MPVLGRLLVLFHLRRSHHLVVKAAVVVAVRPGRLQVASVM